MTQRGNPDSVETTTKMRIYCRYEILLLSEERHCLIKKLKDRIQQLVVQSTSPEDIKAGRFKIQEPRSFPQSRKTFRLRLRANEICCQCHVWQRVV